MATRISLRFVTATQLDIDSNVHCTVPANNQAGNCVIVECGSTRRSCVASKDLIDTTSFSKSKDFEWYFEQYVALEPFAYARARAIKRKIQEQGRKLLKCFVQPVLPPSLWSGQNLILEICHSADDQDASGSIEYDVFWEVLEDLSLWQTALGFEPRQVTVIRVLQHHSAPLEKASSSQRHVGLDERGMHVLAITARPSHTKDVPHRLITRSISTAVEAAREDSNTNATLTVVRPGTFEAFESAIMSRPYGYFNVVHLDMHGLSDEKGTRLIFVESRSDMRLQPDPIEARSISSLLVKRGVKILVINACRSAMASDKASNIARLLVQAGVKIAIGMSYNVFSLSADRFMREFYTQYLAHHVSPIAAVAYARRELRRNTTRLSKFHTELDLEDHLVPVVLCQASELHNIQDAIRDGLDEIISSEVTPSPLPSELVGREGDILELEWSLVQRGATRIHLQGAPGVGKTKLIKEASKWWQHTGLFGKIIHLDLSKAAFQKPTPQIIMEEMALQDNIDVEGLSSKELAATLDKSSTLIVLDSFEALQWSPGLTISECQRHFRLSLHRLKKCSVIISSRAEDAWLQNAVSSQISLAPLNLSNTILLASSLLHNLNLSSKVATQADQSYFEQLITMAKGNPLAIQIMVFDLAKHLADDPSITIVSHLLSLLRLRPVYLNMQRLAAGGDTRSITEILEWALFDSMAGPLQDFTGPATMRDSIFEDFSTKIPDNRLSLLEYSVGVLNLGLPKQVSVASHCRDNQTLREYGFHPTVMYLGFWHIIPHSLETFILTMSIILVCRRNLDPQEYRKFRIRLCEHTDQESSDPHYVSKRLRGKDALGLSPETVQRCLEVASIAQAKFHADRIGRLRHYIEDQVSQQLGSQGNQLPVGWASMSPLLSLVCQSGSVQTSLSPSIAEDFEIARDAQYRHRIFEWVDRFAIQPTSKFHEAMKIELNIDFFNYLGLFLSYHQLNSWPVEELWMSQLFVFVAALADSRRTRLIETVLSSFIDDALEAVFAARHRLKVPGSAGYDMNSQRTNYTLWSRTSTLEITAINSLIRAISCSELLQNSIQKYMIQWKRVTARPMFQAWRYCDPDLRDFTVRTITLNTQWFKQITSQAPLDVASTQAWLTESEEYRSQVARFMGLPEPTPIELSQSKPWSQRLIENVNATIGGRDSTLGRAHAAVHKIGTEDGKIIVSDAEDALIELEALLSEEAENSDNITTRMSLHKHLANVHEALGHRALAIQHRTIREDLKLMLQPEQVFNMLDPQVLQSSFVKEDRRARGVPVNMAQSLNKQLEISQTELTQAQARQPPDELHVLACLDKIGDLLLSLGRETEAANNYLRVINGRKRLSIPDDDRKSLSTRFARAKILNNIGRYDESIQELRQLRIIYAEVGDAEVLAKVTGMLGQTLERSVRRQRSTLPKAELQLRLQEAEILLKEDAQKAEDLFEPGDVNISTAMANLATLYDHQDDFENAQKYYMVALRVHRQRTDDSADRSILMTQNNLACLWLKMRRYEEAIDLLKRIMDLSVRNFELWHSQSCVIISNLHYAYYHQNKKEEASLFIQSCISRFQSLLDEVRRTAKAGEFDEIYAKYRFGRLLADCDAHEQAVPLLEETLVIWRDQQRTDDSFIELLQCLQKSYSAQNPPRLESEYEILIELVELQKKFHVPNSSIVQTTTSDLVVCLRRLKRYEEAIEIQKKLIEDRRSMLGITHETTMVNISYLAAIYEDQSEWAKALKLRQELYDAQNFEQPDNPKTLGQASSIAFLYEKLRDWDKVIQLRRIEVTDWRRVEGPDSKNALVALSSLIIGLEEQQQLTEAKKYADELIGARSRLFSPIHYTTLETQRLKARICRKAGDLDTSQQILEHLLSLKASFGPTDDTHCLVLASLSGLFLARGDLSQAVHTFRNACVQGDAIPGTSSSGHSITLAQLGMAIARECDKAQRWADVHFAAERALSVWRTRKVEAQQVAVMREMETLVSKSTIRLSSDGL